MVRRADLGGRQPALPLLKQRRAQFGFAARGRGLFRRLVRAVAAADAGCGQLARQVGEVGVRVAEIRLDLVTLRIRFRKAEHFLRFGRGQLLRPVHAQGKRIAVRAVLGHLQPVFLAQRARARVPQQRRDDPRERRAHRAHRVLRQLVQRREPRPLFERLLQRPARAGDDELLLRAGQRNIQYAQLLAHHLAPLLDSDRRALDRVILHAARAVAALASKAQLLMHEHRLAQVGFIELLGAVRHDHDRELEALGLVDGQDAHRAAGRLRTHGLEILAGLLHAAQQAHEREQAAEALPLERARPLEKRQKVTLPLRAVRQRAVQPQCAGLVIDLPQQAIDRLVAGEFAQKVQPLQKRFRLGEIRARGQQRVVVAHLAVDQTDVRQLLFGKADERRAQHADQVDVLPRVVDDAEERHHRADLGGLEQAAALLRARGDAHLLKRGDERARLGLGRAQQDDDIPGRDRAQRACALVGHRKALVQQLPDAPRGEPRLERGLVRRVVVLAEIRRIHEQHLGPVARVARLRVVVRAEVQRFAVGILQIAHGLAHDGREQVVARIQHRRTRAEVLPEDHAARLAVLRLVRVRERTVFGQEDGRVGQAEAVNALLDVAHHEQVGFISGQRAEDRVLHRVRVLILVHRDLGKALGQGFREPGRLAPVIQQAHREVLEVIEVRRIARALGGGKRVVKRVHHVAQRGERGRGQAAVVLGFLRRDGQPLVADGFGDGFPLLAHGLDLLKEGLVLEFARGPQPVEGDASRGLDAGIPVPAVQRVQQAFSLVEIACQRGQVGVRQLVDAGHLVHRRAQERRAVLRRCARLRKQHAAVRRVHAAGVQPLAHIREERTRVGMRLYLFVSA